MDCKGKLSCFKLETCSLIFAVINAVSWAVSTIASIGLLIAVNVLPTEPYTYQFYDENGYYKDTTYTPRLFMGVAKALVEVIFSVLLIICLINFLFAVLLCNGITKRNTGHIKAYFIFGIVKAVLFSITTIVFIVIEPSSSVLILPIGVYCMILHMINMTREKFLTGDIINNHKRLVAC